MEAVSEFLHTFKAQEMLGSIIRHSQCLMSLTQKTSNPALNLKQKRCF